MKFKLCSVLFELQFLVVAVMSMVLILDSSNRFLCCFISALIHECGHLIAMCICHIKPSAIRLRLFDIVIESDTMRDQSADFFITLAGPAVNLLCACVFYYISKTLFISNLVIGLFNLLPVLTFDGGHAVEIILSQRFSVRTCNIVLKSLTFIVLLPMFTMGVMVLFESTYNYSLLLISLYLVAILFLR